MKARAKHDSPSKRAAIDEGYEASQRIPETLESSEQGELCHAAHRELGALCAGR
jgi:hypothetical protein